MALEASGIPCPRDTDMQEKALGRARVGERSRQPQARRSRLLEWPCRHHDRSYPHYCTPTATTCRPSWNRCGNAVVRIKTQRRRNNRDQAALLIAERPVDGVFKRPPRLVSVDLPQHVSRDRLGIGIGRAMRCDRHLGMRPKRTVRRQRFGHEHIESRGMEFAGIECGDKIGFDLLFARVPH